ncbi:ArnT family glycosyltransferase [Elusimicrobiota bacterium]
MQIFEQFLSNKRFLFLFVALVAGISIFNWLSESPLAGDDCYYSGVAREMVRTGDYLTPRSQFGPDFHTSKPPMLYWMNAVSGKIFGFDTFAMRLPSAILGFLCILALFFFCAKYFNLYFAFIAAITLTFTQQYVYHARSAVTDGPFAVFFALSLFAFWIARTEKNPTFYYLMGFFAGLAIMTRQIPGLFIFCIVFSYIVLSKEYDIFKNIHFYGAILLTGLIIFPWHITMYIKHGEFFLNQYFRVALMTGISGYPESYSSNPSLNPWYGYFSILLSNYWPWLPFFIVGIYKLVKKYFTDDRQNRAQILFILLWAFVPFVIFQIAKVKQYHYLVPLYIPFAIITAVTFDSFAQKLKIKAAFILSSLVAVLAAAYLFFPIVPKTLDSSDYVKNMMFLSEAKEIKGDIIALKDWFAYYSNFLWFYADKKVVENTEAEIKEKVRGKKEYFFIMSNEVFKGFFTSEEKKKLKTIKQTEESVLFSNI